MADNEHQVTTTATSPTICAYAYRGTDARDVPAVRYPASETGTNSCVCCDQLRVEIVPVRCDGTQVSAYARPTPCPVLPSKQWSNLRGNGVPGPYRGVRGRCTRGASRPSASSAARNTCTRVASAPSSSARSPCPPTGHALYWSMCLRAVRSGYLPTRALCAVAYACAMRCPVQTQDTGRCAYARATRCPILTEGTGLCPYARAMRCPADTLAKHIPAPTLEPPRTAGIGLVVRVGAPLRCYALLLGEREGPRGEQIVKHMLPGDLSICLPASYAVSGTRIAGYAATRTLRMRYGMRGADVAYGLTHVWYATRRTKLDILLPCSALSWLCYTVRGTELGMLLPGMPADKCGKIKVGDVLVEVTCACGPTHSLRDARY
eukprot:2126323-Rhodomonas_salina.4